MNYICGKKIEMPKDKKEPVRISDFETYNVNPSIKKIIGLHEVAKMEHDKRQVIIVDKETSESEEREIDAETYNYNGSEWKDRGRFTKLFQNTEDEIRELSSTSIFVLMYIIGLMKHGVDVVRVDAEDCRAFLKYKSRISVYDGLFGLLKAKFIYRKAGWDGEYFVNVNKIFKGHRAKLKE